MGKTSAAVKNRYAAKAYDRIQLVVKKGKKDEIKAFAERRGYTVNGFVNEAIDEKMQRDEPAQNGASSAKTDEPN